MISFLAICGFGLLYLAIVYLVAWGILVAWVHLCAWLYHPPHPEEQKEKRHG